MNGASGAAAPESEGAPDEEILLDRVRAGDGAAFERLYAAHAAAARRLAVILAGADGAEELVSESFARILDQLRAGGGPTTNFRAYLHTTIRNRHRDVLRATRERPSSDQPWLLDTAEPPADELVAGIDSNGAVAALSSLPGQWQQVLWHLEVEGRKPAEIAELLTMTPAAVSSLAYRAREGLRRAYLDQHFGPARGRADCRWTRARLSQYVRDDLSRRASAKVADHLDSCAACASTFAEMDELNKKLAAFLFPLVLVGGMHAIDVAALSGSAAGSLVGELTARADGVPTGEAISSVGGSNGAGGPGSFGGLSTQALAVVGVGLAAVAAVAIALAVDGEGPKRSPDESVVRIEDDGSPPPSAPPARPSPAVESPTPEPETVPPTGPSPQPDTSPASNDPMPTGPEPGPTAEPEPEPSRGPEPEPPPDPEPEPHGDPPSIGGVTKVSTGDPASDPWAVRVTPVVPDPTPQILEVTYLFDTGVLIVARAGSGWTCREPGGVEVGAGTEYLFDQPGIPFTCTFDYTGVSPPPVTLTVYGVDADLQIVEPNGFVSLSSDGVAHDFQGMG